MRDRVTVRLNKNDKELTKFIESQDDISYMGRIAFRLLYQKIGMKDVSQLKQRIEKFGLSNLEIALKKD